jgi:Nucleoside H+ symporter
MPRASKLQICLLMFLQGFALGAYVVPLPFVLKAYGLGAWISFPYIISALAAFVSPLIFGSLADRKFAPEKLLALVIFGSAVLMLGIAATLHFGWGTRAYLVATTCYALWAAPGFGLLTGIGLKNVDHPEREFAPLRVWATVGFMAAPALLAIVGWDRSAISQLVGAAFFLVESVVLLRLPSVRPSALVAPKRWRDYFGWDALQLLRERDHCMIFVTTALFSMPLAAFYPYVGKHLDTLQATFPGARMALAQTIEVLGMFGLAVLMTRFRLKWLIVAALVCGALRYACFIPSHLGLLMLGISMHGLVFILFTMTTQIYLEQRVPHALRNQSQALLAFMSNGIGNLCGYVGGNLLYLHCQSDGVENWAKFWFIQTAVIIPVTLFFLIGYRGRVNYEVRVEKSVRISKSG